jgi:hypothetical protein
MSRREKINAEIMRCEMELDALLGAMLGAKSEKKKKGTIPAGENRVAVKLQSVSNVLAKVAALKGAAGVLAEGIIAALRALPKIKRTDTTISSENLASIKMAAQTIGGIVTAFAATATNAKELAPIAAEINSTLTAYSSKGDASVDAFNKLLQAIGRQVEKAPVAGLEQYLMAIGLALRLNTGTEGLTD